MTKRPQRRSGGSGELDPTGIALASERHQQKARRKQAIVGIVAAA
jgi:hypothetical protein